MSTNPFRRSSLKSSLPAVSAPETTFTQTVANQSGLHIDTSSLPPFTTGRHVSFASPPVDASIDPASYPSSPESTRSPQPTRALPPILSYVDYESTPSAPPPSFRTFSFGANTGLDAQALDGTPELTTPLTDSDRSLKPHRTEVDDSIHTEDDDTRQHREESPSVVITHVPAKAAASPSSAIDVDAFARLLMTGTRATATATPKPTTPPPLPTTRRGSRMKPIITSTSSPSSSRRPSYDPTSQHPVSVTTDRRTAPDPTDPDAILSQTKTTEAQTGSASTQSKFPHSAPPLPPPRRRRASSKASDDSSGSRGQGL